MMLYQHKAIQVTSRAAGAEPDLHQLAAHYAYPTNRTGPWIRANMISTIDGAAAVDGLSGGLGGPGDKAVFRTLRGLADVVVVGARTAVAEGYHQPQPDSIFAEARIRAAQAPAPTLVLVSNSLSLPADLPLLAHPGTFVVTTTDAPAHRRALLESSGATLADCGTGSVDPHAVAELLNSRGLHRVLCEGGPSLLGAFIAADLLDEICVTTSPTLAAGDAARIAHGASVTMPTRMRPAQILSDDDGFVFTRWIRP